MSVVANGEKMGTSFLDLTTNDRSSYLGDSITGDFPLLVKIIDTQDDLSIQVHPDDAYAHEAEGVPFGKNELWYILDAPENSALIIGVKEGIMRDAFEHALNKNEKSDITACLNYLSIKKGDVINIPAGLIHAITKGVRLAEIQQNSDITYRVYDYGRLGTDNKPRQLHILKALDVSDFSGKIKKAAVTGIALSTDGVKKTFYIANKFYCLIKYDIETAVTERSDNSKFFIFTCVDGSCTVSAVTGDRNVVETVSLTTAESVFIPAHLGEYTITGRATLLKSFVPDIDSDFINPLTSAGYTEQFITEHTSLIR